MNSLDTVACNRCCSEVSGTTSTARACATGTAETGAVTGEVAKAGLFATGAEEEGAALFAGSSSGQPRLGPVGAASDVSPRANAGAVLAWPCDAGAGRIRGPARTGVTKVRVGGAGCGWSAA